LYNIIIKSLSLISFIELYTRILLTVSSQANAHNNKLISSIYNGQVITIINISKIDLLKIVLSFCLEL